jgi:putative hydroxymethylpyrimidine transport system ATP-binding protein
VLAATLLAGRTVLLVTHDPLEALRLGHRIQVMTGHPARIEGTILPAGAPPRDLHDPALLARQGELLAWLAETRDDAA